MKEMRSRARPRWRSGFCVVVIYAMRYAWRFSVRVHYVVGTMTAARLFKTSPDGSGEVVFLLVPNFSLLAFTSTIEPLRLANDVSGRALYHWRLISCDGEPVRASNGVLVAADESIYDPGAVSLNVVLCAGANAQHYQDEAVIGWLRHRARQGAHIGALCAGSHVLARAGITHNTPITVDLPDPAAGEEVLSDNGSDLAGRAGLLVNSAHGFSCKGGAEALDMLIQELTLAHGCELANDVSQQFVNEGGAKVAANGNGPAMHTRNGTDHPKLLEAIAAMERNTKMPLSRDEIAARARLSRRQLERLFLRHLNTSPARYYLRLRLIRARMLLSRTPMPITEVALACGFASAAHFSKCYRDMYKYPPSSERRAFSLGKMMQGLHTGEPGNGSNGKGNGNASGGGQVPGP